MKQEPLPQHEAGRLFVQMLVNHCYEGITPTVMETLQDAPPGGRPSADALRRFKWFQSLQASDQEEVQGVVEYSLELCLFHLLNILDGTSPIQPMEQPSDFAVYLQTYASDEDQERNEPNTTMRVNPWSPMYESGDEQLHDIFSELMGDALER